jgi:hypothetical protein
LAGDGEDMDATIRVLAGHEVNRSRESRARKLLGASP